MREAEVALRAEDRVQLCDRVGMAAVVVMAEADVDVDDEQRKFEPLRGAHFVHYVILPSTCQQEHCVPLKRDRIVRVQLDGTSERCARAAQLIPGSGGTQRLPCLVGIVIVHQMMASGPCELVCLPR